MTGSTGNDPQGRRRFLSAAVLGTTGAIVTASALGVVTPQAAMAGPRGGAAKGIAPGGIDPNFAEGRITAIAGGTLSVTGSDRVLHRIRVTGATSVWKLRATTLEDAKVGDGLYARGVLMDDGTLAADAVWLNIVNLDVRIVAITSSALRMEHNGKRITGHVVRGTTAAVYNGTPAVSDLSLLAVGKHVQIVGAWRPDTSEVDVATVYAAA